MKKVNFKYLPLLISSMAVQIATDPSDFGFKVKERLRQRGLFEAQRLEGGATPRSLIDKARLQGEDAKGLLKLIWRAEKARLDVDFPSRTKTKVNTKHWKLTVYHYLTNSYPHSSAGYAERTHKNLRAQVMSGIKVKAFTRGSYPLDVGVIPDTSKDTIEGVQYYRILPPVHFPLREMRDEYTVRYLVGQAKKAHILHTTTGFHNAHIVARAAAQLEIPWVYEVRGEPESTWVSKFEGKEREAAENSDYVKLCREKETEAARTADHLVVLSDISKRDFVERGIPEERITVIPNGVDEELIARDFDKAEIREELGLPCEVKIVGSITSVVHYEGLEYLIRALEFLPEYKALIVGDGVELPKLRELAEELKFADRVIFAGRRPNDEIWKWYAALDVFAVPRLDVEVCRKITPLKALIAQAIGIPVVASNLPALTEVTGYCETYANPEDSYDLAKKILSIEERQGNRSLLWASERTWRSNGDRFLDLYKKIISLNFAL